MTVGVPINFSLGGNALDRLEEMARKSKTVGQALKGIGDGTKLAQLGRELQDASEGMHQFRSGIDDTVEQLNILGDAGAALVGEINKIQDPLKRAELAQQALAGGSSKLGQSMTGVTQRFEEMRIKAAIAVGGVENLSLIMGAAGLAAGALAAAIGGTLAAAYARATNGLEKYLEKNKEAKALQDFATQAADANAQELGKSLVKVSTDFDLATSSSTAFFDKYLTGASRILQEQSTYSKEFENIWGRKVPSLLVPAVDLVGDIGRGFADATFHLDKFSKAVDILAKPLKNTNTASQTLTQTFNGQKLAIDQLALALKTYGDGLDEIARKAQSATPYLDALAGGEGTGSSLAVVPRIEAARRGGGGGGRPSDRRQRFGASLAGAVGGAAGLGQEGGQAAGGLAGIAGGAGAGPLGQAGARGQSATALGDKDLAALGQGVARAKAVEIALGGARRAADGLAGSLADVAAGLASGGLKAGDFGAAIKGAFGGIFQDLGKGFVLQGTALLFTPGGQAAGAGMIAAGLGLSALGGLMSRGGGSSAAASGGSSGSAGAVASAARQASTAAPQGDQGPRVVVLRVGERELQGTLVELTQDGQTRGMGRRQRAA